VSRDGAPGLISPSFQLGLLAVAIIASTMADLSRPLGLALLGGVTVVALLVTPSALRTYLRRPGPLLSFGLIALALVLLAPVTPGTPTTGLPWVGHPVSAQSLRFLASVWTKSALVLAWVTVFAQRLSDRDLLEGLTGLRLPSRVTGLCYLMVRNLQGVGAEVRRLVRACEARGRPRGWRAITVAAAIAGVLLMRLARRADSQALALVARGFQGPLPLLDWRPLRAGQAMALLGLGGALVCLTRL
jgi:cobalt/nickel transport system permease protein